MTIRRWISILTIASFLYLSACTGLGSSTNPPLTASGTTSVLSVQVAPEISGKILTIKVAQGDPVNAGDVLFTLDDQLLQAQYQQANAAVQLAQANLQLAQDKLTGAQTQYDLIVQQARLQDQANQTADWKTSPPGNATLPGWYFQKDEKIMALQAEVAAAQKGLEDESSALDAELKNASNQDFIGAEKRLIQAEEAELTAQTTLDQAKAAKDTTDLVDAAQKKLDSANSELDAAQKAYDQMLSSEAASRVREARARLAVARDRLTNAEINLDRAQTGEQSLQVAAAQSALDQAKSGVAQAQAALTQAQATLQLAKTQLAKTVIISPTSGIVLSRPMNAGEVAATGATVLEIGDLDQVTLDVYLPENQYGKIHLGQTAKVSVDSFPGKTFEGKVTYIADQAEFTPRTVQTVESRSTTVYKVEITIPNPDHDLKPGMPADATFVTPGS